MDHPGMKTIDERIPASVFDAAVGLAKFHLCKDLWDKQDPWTEAIQGGARIQVEGWALTVNVRMAQAPQ